MAVISPSLLSCDFSHLALELERLETIPDIWLHLDIMDGHFVKNLTFAGPIIRSMLPHTNHPLDAHLMVSNPQFHLEEMKDIPLHNFTFHLEACQRPLELINQAKKYFPSVGLSIKPSTSLEEIPLEVLKGLNLVLVMSVNPGHGGQSFIPESLPKIKALRELREKHKLNFIIQVDGGINPETSRLARQAGADNLVAGSAIFKAKNHAYAPHVQALLS